MTALSGRSGDWLTPSVFILELIVCYIGTYITLQNKCSAIKYSAVLKTTEVEMSRSELKNAGRVWDAFMRAVVLAPFGGVGWATTAQVALLAQMSKPTVQKYMLAARERGAVSLVVMPNRQAVWVWEK